MPTLRPTSGRGFLQSSQTGGLIWRIPGRVVGGDFRFTLQPVSGTFSAPHDVPVLAVGASPITYQWQSNFGGPSFSDMSDDLTFDGTATATLTFLGSFPGGPWLFRCVATAGAESVTSDEASINIV